MKLKNQNGGVGVFLLLGALIIPFTIMSMNVGTLHSKRVEFTLASWNKRVALEAAHSALVLIEAALKRRLWESPPDANCLKSESFGVATSQTPEGAEFSVNVTYSPDTGTFNMYATGEYNDAKSILYKSVKVLDASSFLAYSKTPEELVISPGSGIIGKQRRVYFEGPVSFARWGRTKSPHGRVDRATSWSDISQPDLPDELAIIMQAERLQFMSGLKYGEYFIGRPYHTESVLGPLLNPYAENKFAQSPGAAMITNNFSIASSTLDSYLTEDISKLNYNSVKPYVYPKAFSSGNLPIMAQTATDDGTYINDLSKWKSWEYLAGYSYSWGNHIDATCLSEIPGTMPEEQRKQCSNSEHFPKGFKKWVQDANLNNIVLGSESEPINFEKIDWDNFDALKEDAVACGAVITAGTADGKYGDCDLSNEGYLQSYLTSGKPPCEIIHQFDIDNLPAKLNNFNLSTYADPGKKNSFLRRIVYFDMKTEVSQKTSDGLATSLPANIRNSLSFWLVNEDQFVIKPHQPDTTSPLDYPHPNPKRYERRNAYFNQDPSDAVEPLILTLFSPEVVEVISPFHKPYSFTEIQQAYPVFGNKLRPRTHITMDYRHQEDDGFKYGIRNVYIKNVTLISNSQSGSGSGIRLRGLWNANDFPRHTFNLTTTTCLFSPLNNPSGTGRSPYDQTIPTTYVNGSAGLMPPTTSRYYNGGQVSRWHVPYIFRMQLDNGVGLTSSLFFEGIRWLSDFDGTVVAGKRILSQPKYQYKDILEEEVDLSERRITWNMGRYYHIKSNASCIPQNLIYIHSGQPAYDALNFRVNQDPKQIIQVAPSDTLENIGSLYGVHLPVVEIK